MMHQIKIWPEYYARVVSGEKTFEVRRNDRDYQAGDWLVLQEWDPTVDTIDPDQPGVYTGHSVGRFVSYVYAGEGVADGYVVLGIVKADPR